MLEDFRQKHSRLIRGALLVAFIGPFLSVASYSYFKAQQDLTDLALSRRKTVAHLAAVVLKEKLDRIVDLGISLTQRPHLIELVKQGRWEEEAQILSEIPKRFPVVDWITLTDPNGTVMVEVPPNPESVGKSFAYRDWYQGVSRHWQPYVSEGYKRASESPQNVISAGVPIFDEEGKVLGTMALQVRMDTLIEWVKKIEIGPSGFVFFLDPKGHATGHPHFPSQGEIIDFSHTPLAQKALKEKEGIEVLFNPIENVERLVAFESVPGYGWVVVAQEPAKEAFSARTKGLRVLLIGYALLFFLSCVVAVLILRQLAEHEESERKLKASEIRYRRLFETAKDGILLMNAQTAEVIDINPALEQLFGFSRHDVVGKPFWESPLFKVMVTSMEEFNRWKKRETFHQESLELQTAHRGLIEMEMMCKFYMADTQGIIQCNFRDVTERKRVEKLRQEHEQWRVINQHKDEFVATVSHELRTPLTAMRESVSLMLDKVLGPTTAEQDRFLKITEESVKRLAGLIDNLLDLSRIEAGRLALNRRRVSVERLIQNALMSYKAVRVKRTVEVKSSKVPEVFADPDRMMQVLGNLISNALKFSQEGGRLTISFQEKSGEVAISVQDDGVGITSEDIPKLFQKFSQVGQKEAKRSRGTGLGLALCKELVELHDGQISVVSEPGRGSTFTFTLPVFTSRSALEKSFQELEEANRRVPGSMPGLIAIEVSDAEKMEQVADRIRRGLPPVDRVLTLESGWVVVLTSTEHLEGFKAMQEQIREFLQKGAPGALIKMGSALAPMDGKEVHQLFAKATQAAGS